MDMRGTALAAVLAVAALITACSDGSSGNAQLG